MSKLKNCSILLISISISLRNFEGGGVCNYQKYITYILFTTLHSDKHIFKIKDNKYDRISTVKQQCQEFSEAHSFKFIIVHSWTFHTLKKIWSCIKLKSWTCWYLPLNKYVFFSFLLYTFCSSFILYSFFIFGSFSLGARITLESCTVRYQPHTSSDSLLFSMYD